jgi:hypothetical protein
MRMVLLVCAGCGAVLNVAIGAYADSEHALFMNLLAQFKPGMLVILDHGFASFVLLNLARQRQAHFLVRVSARMLKTSKRTLGYRDDVREWRRPSPSQSVFAQLLGQLPESMEVRVIERSIRRAGYRTWTLRIATSLLDPATYPADDLIELYLRRWRIEAALRTLKTHADRQNPGRGAQGSSLRAAGAQLRLRVDGSKRRSAGGAEPQACPRNRPDLRGTHGLRADREIARPVPRDVAYDCDGATNAAGARPRAPRHRPAPQHLSRTHDLAQ